MQILILFSLYIATFYLLKKVLWNRGSGKQPIERLTLRSLFLAVIIAPTLTPLPVMTAVPMFAVLVFYSYMLAAILSLDLGLLVLAAMLGLVPIAIVWLIIFVFGYGWAKFRAYDSAR